ALFESYFSWQWCLWSAGGRAALFRRQRVGSRRRSAGHDRRTGTRPLTLFSIGGRAGGTRPPCHRARELSRGGIPSAGSGREAEDESAWSATAAGLFP